MKYGALRIYCLLLCLASIHANSDLESLHRKIERHKMLIAQLREKKSDDYDVTTQNIDSEDLRAKEEKLKELEAQYNCLMSKD